MEIIKDISKSKVVRGVIIGLLALVLVLVVFRLGMSFGYRNSRFSERFGDNYQRNFIDPRDRNDFMWMGMRGGQKGIFSNDSRLSGGNGAVGKIVSVALPNIVVAGADNLEKTVIVNDSTLVRQFREELKSSNLKVGDYVVILGNPNDQGQIDAKLIRIVPAPVDNSQPVKTIKK